MSRDTFWTNHVASFNAELEQSGLKGPGLEASLKSEDVFPIELTLGGRADELCESIRSMNASMIQRKLEGR